ncbi:MAG: glycosyltransferase family 4 protein [Candidatus Omnitrophica bacterium]|nr:glycosyltransferase family 4 protein [Candidatus Omnitrophota bacterium]
MKTGIPKIAVVIPKYGLVGGGEKFAAELTERIARAFPCEMHVFANRWNQRSGLIRFHKVPIISFPKYLTTVSFAWFAQRAMAKIGFDIIHAHERIFAADMVSLHSIPHRLWVRAIRRKRFLSLFDRATINVEKAMVRNNDKALFLPVSSIARDQFLSEYPHVANRVEVMHPGVDLSEFERLDRSRCRTSIRGQYGLLETDTVLLFAGMNFELKGLEQVILALGRIKTIPRERPLKLLVVGKGDENKYKAIARNAGIADDIRFAGIRREKMEEIYLAADLFAMLSSFDTFGMTVLEAMAASLPVIISPHVGAGDLVQEGVNGFIVARDDIDAVSRRIQLLLDPEKRMAMGNHAYQVAQDHHWDNMAHRVIGLYERILAGKVNPVDRRRHIQ